MTNSVLDRLHDAAIRVQLPVVLVAIPLTTALYAVTFVPIVLDVALEEASEPVAASAARAAWLATALLVGVVTAATVAAGLLLRGSLRAAVECLHAATTSIAAGDFRHRVDSPRTDELGRLAGAIDAMATRLQSLEQARRRTLACVSHELRTPLTIIQGHAFTLTRDEQVSSRRERLELVQLEAMRLARLVDDMVDASTLHAGGVRLSLSRLDLAALVSEQVDRFRHAASRLDVRLEHVAGEPVPVDGDAARLGQVVANLLANAIRHARPGTTVSLTTAIGRGGIPLLQARNRSEPIPAGIAGQVFEPFVQGDARSGSVGLGLAVVRAIVEAHGGHVELDEERARRGDVRFTVRLEPPVTARVERARRRPAWQRSRLGLVVEP